MLSVFDPTKLKFGLYLGTIIFEWTQKIWIEMLLISESHLIGFPALTVDIAMVIFVICIAQQI